MGRFAKHRPNVYAKKEGVIFILAVVLLLSPAPCRGDAVFRCESESTLFGLPKEDTTRNQWLSCIYNAVPEQFNPNIRVCAAHFTEDCFLNLGEYVPAVHKGCFYKVGQFQLCKDSLALLTQPVSMFSYLKNLPLTIQTRFQNTF